MSTRARLRPATSRRVVALAAVLSMSTPVQSVTPAACGMAVSPDAAAVRLNDVRLRGATCRSGPMSTASALVWNDRLADAARAQAREMARIDRMSHRDSQNRGLGERLRIVGYPLGVAVENVGVGFASVDDVVDAWLDSEGHCENLMNASVREFGIACVDADASGTPEERRYWALVLGAPRGSR